MKIGIVTHRLMHNYGGTLQAFALQEVLRRMGHEPITIDYLPDEMTKARYVLAQIKTLFYHLAFRRSRRFFVYPVKKRKPEFALFMGRHMNMTERVKKYKLSVLRKYGIEALVVGSDQVWRSAFNSPSVQLDLYLRFAKNFKGPKIAYAASFGVDKWTYSPKLTEECAKYAKLFKAISTREDSGVKLCSDYLKVKAEGVLDPTLLLDKEDYMDLCKDIPEKKKPFLLAYLLNMNDEMKKDVNAFADKNGLPVIFVSSEKSVGYSVEEWLSLYRDAAFVVTNSFHGTVFSIINNKDFYSIKHELRGADRFVSILSRFNLGDRLIDGFDRLPDSPDPIDWAAVNIEKSKWQNAGKNFLKINLVQDI